MTTPSKHSGGRAARTPVTYNGQIVPGLFRRRTSDGRLVFEARIQVDGKRKRKTLKAQTATDAVRELRALRTKHEAGGRIITRHDVSLRELRDKWAEWATSPGSPYAPRTVEYNLSALDRRALRLLGGDTKATAVRPAHLRVMIDRLSSEGFSGSTVHGTVTALSAVFRFAIRRDLAETNPVRLLERDDRPSTKRRKEPNYLDREQAARLLAELSDEWRPVAAACLYAGLRISEALALRWQDVDFDAGELWVAGTKTAASAASVPLAPVLADELRAHRRSQPGVGDALVFRTGNGTPQDRKNAGRAVRAAGRRAGVGSEKPLSPHDLRHSCASLLFEAGVPPIRVARILRHADPRVTLTVYAGLADSQLASLGDDLQAAFR